MIDVNVPRMSFLVIRVGKVYDVSTKAYINQDPILEIDKVLKRFDTCLFAKFGKKLNLNKINKLAEKTNIHLVVVNKVGEGYKSKTYKLNRATNDVDIKAKNFPPYYKGKEEFIGTWFELSSGLYEASLADLYVASSYKKLMASMSSSMSSFFFCKL